MVSEKIKELSLKYDDEFFPEITQAQFVLESKNGTSDLAVHANNPFGIKASDDWTGDSYTKKTQEWDGTKYITVAANFRKYPTLEDAFKDHNRFMSRTAWHADYYADALNAKNYTEQAYALEGTYATDPQYAEKLLNIIDSNSVVDPNGYVVGLDIGHGQDTFPASGKGVYKNGIGYAEYDFNSMVGARIKELLEANGFTILLSQPLNANDVSLTQRTDYFNEQDVDIVLSIHANAGVVDAFGRCAFYWHDHEESEQFANLIVDNLSEAGYTTHGVGLHASMVGSWTNLHMVRETKMTAVLVEHGFMTNSRDFELIFGKSQSEYVEDMANADAKAICEYFSVAFNGNVVANPVIPAPSYDTISAGANSYIVQSGDTLGGIAADFGTTVDVLLSINKIANPNLINPGQVIQLQNGANNGKVYVVKSGDTLSSIAEDHATTANALAQANNIANPDLITVGQELVISGAGSPTTYTIQEGDTLGDIANKYGTTVNELVMVNGITDPDNISVGQMLTILGGGNKSIDVVAKEVLNGDWGNNPHRKEALEAQGYDYDEVQARVEQLL